MFYTDLKTALELRLYTWSMEIYRAEWGIVLGGLSQKGDSCFSGRRDKDAAFDTASLA
jgi:hypothetical protein